MNNRTGIAKFELNGSSRDVGLFATAANVTKETKAGSQNNHHDILSRSVSLPSSRLCCRFYQDTIRQVTNENTYTFNKIETYVEDAAMHDR